MKKTKQPHVRIYKVGNSDYQRTIVTDDKNQILTNIRIGTEPEYRLAAHYNEEREHIPEHALYLNGTIVDETPICEEWCRFMTPEDEMPKVLDVIIMYKTEWDEIQAENEADLAVWRGQLQDVHHQYQEEIQAVELKYKGIKEELSDKFEPVSLTKRLLHKQGLWSKSESTYSDYQNI